LHIADIRFIDFEIFVVRVSAVVSALAMLLAFADPSFGQAPGGASSAGQPALVDMPRAPVVIDSEQLFLVRGVSAYPAEQRAREIKGRIEAFAADGNLPLTSLTLDERSGVSAIVGNGRPIVTVLDDDAELEQVDRQVLAQVFLARIRNAVEAHRRAREPGRLARHTLYVLAATLMLLSAGYAGRRLVTALHSRIEQRYHARVHDLHIQAFQIVQSKQIWHLLAGVLNLAWMLGVVAMGFIYLRYVFGLFPWTRGLGNSLLSIAITPLQTMAAGLIANVPNIVFLIVLVLVIRYALKLIRLFFQALADGSVTLATFDPEWAWPTYRLVRLLVIGLAVVVAYPYIPGSHSDAFKGVSLFVGVLFSLGSSSFISNIVAGYSMTYRRAFRIGDRVKIGEHIGEVERMGLLVTYLRSPKNEEVIVPNSMILGAEVVNYSSMARDRGLILHTTVGIGYETPWRQVEAMLIEAATRTPGLRREPAPFVLQRALGDFAVTYEINAYTDSPDAMLALYTALHRNILDVFNEYGVQIMTPAYEGDPEQPKLVPKAHWYTAPARRPDNAEDRQAGTPLTPDKWRVG
jgi:small-conductance mechanosensitive channel